MSQTGASTNVFTGDMKAATAFMGSNINTVNIAFHREHEKDKLRLCMDTLEDSSVLDIRGTLAPQHVITEENWILEEPTFSRWKQEENVAQRILWVCDDPSEGKTTLAIFISQHLEQLYPANDDPWVLHYFCDRRYEERNTATGILKGFLHQILQKRPDLFRILYEKYEVQKNMFKADRFEALWTVFRDTIHASKTNRMFCIIDGIDQCRNDESLVYLLQGLRDFVAGPSQESVANRTEPYPGTSAHVPSYNDTQSNTGPDLRLMVLSCEKPHCIKAKLKDFPRLTLKGNPYRNITKQRHVQTMGRKVSVSLSGKRGPDDQTVKLVTEILDQGHDRSFLWVNLMAEKLMGMKSSQVKDYAVKAPKTLDDLYIQTLLEIPYRQRPHVSAILRWTALAVRPLSPLELTKAVKYLLNKRFSRKALKEALAQCRGLVYEQVHEGRISVVLADRSVETLILGKESALHQREELKEFVFQRSDVHSQLANTCIEYLQISANMEKSRRVRIRPGDKLSAEDAKFLRRHPFLEYAIISWPIHAQQGNPEKTDFDVPFFYDRSIRRKMWWESYWISLRKSFRWKWTTPGAFSLLHIAAFFDIVPLALHVERNGRILEFLSAEDYEGKKAIHRATERSSKSMLQFLLERGEYDEEALRQAARGGQVSIIKMLLDNRETIRRTPSLQSSSVGSRNPFNYMRKTALSTISEWSKPNKSEEDTQSPKSPEERGYGRVATETPLHIAATCGHEEAVDVLLKYGEDPYKATEGGWAPLHNAAWFGRTAVVQLLITADADLQANTKEQLTPLHCAAKNCQTPVVECLLATKKVAVDARDQFGLTPFHLACKSQSISTISVMKTLLDHGADIEAKMGLGWTPLIWACVNDRFPVADFLLRRGADFNVKWTHTHTELGKHVELSVLDLAKAYKPKKPQSHEQESIISLLERYGVSDSARVESEGAEDLPAIDPIEETYDVPVVNEIIIFEEESSEAQDNYDADGMDSESESDDCNNDIDSPSSLQSRQGSGSGTENDSETRGDSLVSVLGLGIHGARNVDGCFDHIPVGEEELDQSNAASPSAIVVTTDQAHSVEGLPQHLEAKINVEIQGSPDLIGEQSVTVNNGQPLPSNELGEEKTINGASACSPVDEISTGGMKSRFGRFMPRKGSSGTSNASIKDNSAEIAASPVAFESTSEDISQAVATPEQPNGKSKPAFRAGFSTRRLLGWKSEAGSETQKTALPILEETMNSEHSVETLEESSVLPSKEDVVGKTGRFGTMKLFRWGSGSSEHEVLNSVSCVPSYPVIENHKEPPTNVTSMNGEDPNETVSQVL